MADDFDVRHPLEAAPPLAGVAAISGLVATLVVRVLIPTRDVSGSMVAWTAVERIGAFAVNLAAIAAVVALVLGLWPWLRVGDGVSGRRRLLVASFAGMLLPVWLRAVFFPREDMNGALVSLGAAAACSLSVLLVISAARGNHPRAWHLLPIGLVTSAALSSLTLLTLQSIAVVAPFSQVHRAGWIIADVGEVAYLGVMLCAVALLPRYPWSPRNIVAVTTGAVVALVILIAFQFAMATLSREFAVALYYAQHVTLFLDGSVWIYAVPLSAGIGAATAAMIGSDPRAQQLGIAVLCWVGAGFAARAPWRFSLLALSACLLARAISARTTTAKATTTVTAATAAAPAGPTSATSSSD